MQDLASVTIEAQLGMPDGSKTVYIEKATMDTGAKAGTYAGLGVIRRLGAKLVPSTHRARLGDGKTVIRVAGEACVTLALYTKNGKLTAPERLKVYVLEDLGDEVLVGLPDILLKFYEFFSEILNDSREALVRAQILKVEAMPLTLEDKDQGVEYEPWSKPIQTCVEEDETLDSLAMGEDVLNFMENTIEESMREYDELLKTQVDPAMKAACPKIMELLQSDLAKTVFVPTEWLGLRIDPVKITLKGDLPDTIMARARPIRPELYEHALKEFERLKGYFYECDPALNDSRYASPLVIAPKATKPFIRFCGDYRLPNQYIVIPQVPIPIVVHELNKAAMYKIYVDLDMTNSFHQLPIDEEFSKVLTVKTPWGLVRPKFLPEGVGPASGLLQTVVRKIFADFEEWTIVIFDNFLVLANDYQDAYDKLEKVLERCREYRVILKMKKSFIGVREANFFGYVLSDGKWRMSESRKDAIEKFPFPTNKKEMQSFLGGALFFHHHIPNYSEWAARLYEMTHEKFSWNRIDWKYDYVTHFNLFKVAIKKAMELHFPDYTLKWILRCDASEFAVGAVLYQIYYNELGEEVYQPIGFTSKRLSEPAKGWDAYKREAYAIFHAVNSFDYYLRGKEFVVETDHRNLQWMETSIVPIICRWRALLQSYQFLVRHIPGSQNKVADWLSRPPVEVVEGAVRQLDHSDVTLDSILREVHGGRSFHYGGYSTWLRARTRYPKAQISIAAVREWVRECSICQKTRETGITSLRSETLSLKPSHYRSVVGVDFATVTPKDKNGFTCVLLVVEHFSHFPVAYPAKDYEAETVAVLLFKHFTTYGTFDAIASDPGSAFMAKVVTQMNQWLGVQHKVSLIGRHQSNGCEGSVKQFTRHLRTLVLDERLYDDWSSDKVLPLVNFFLQSYPTDETGGYTPRQLKYGTEDARRFVLPEILALPKGEIAHQLLQELDKNLRVIRDKSRQFQEDLAMERKRHDESVLKYMPGDLVLFRQKETPCSFLPTKLSPAYVGPFEVIAQHKNDVRVKHLVLLEEHTFHVERLKPFFGTREQAEQVAKHDKHQFFIEKINYFTGNPYIRKSVMLNVTLEGSDVDIPFSDDIGSTKQFQEYARSQKHLRQLLMTAKAAKMEIARVNRCVVTTVGLGQKIWLNIRYWDGERNAWYDALGLPDKGAIYFVELEVVGKLQGGRKVVAKVVIEPSWTVILSLYDVETLVELEEPRGVGIYLLRDDDKAAFPQIFR